MRLVCLLTACTLHIGASSPDANGLQVSPDLWETRSPMDGGGDVTSDQPDLAVIPDLAIADLATADLARPIDLATPRISPIAIENQRPGNREWKLTAPGNGVAGFASQQSYAPGDTIEVHAGGATSVTWEFYRLGWYGGAGARKISSGSASIPPAGAAVMDPSTGMVSAPWATAFTVAIPNDAVTGFYLIKLIASGSQSYVPLVVRGGGAPILWPVPFNTYQAYNAWGGTGLYNNSRSDWSPWHAYAVSFDRPYLQGEGAGQLFFADRDFISFVEGQGYDIDYLAQSDLTSDQVKGRSLITLEGHAEYWSAAERNAVAGAIANGTNLVVFGANDLFWQVRYDTNHRVMTAYKEFANLDPIADPSLKTTQWRDLGLPENAILGVMFGEWIWSSVPFRVSDASHWIWNGTDVSNGSLIPGLYGFEIDRRYMNGSEPSGLTEVGSGLGENHSAQLAKGQATIYTAPSGATVFASGTVSWSQALGWSDRVRQATHNLFSRLGGAGAFKTISKWDAPADPDYLGGVTVSTITSSLASPVAIALAPDGSFVVADGSSLVRVTPTGTISQIATGFAGPRGLAVAADGTIYVADTSNHQIKKVVGSTVSTFAGSTEGYAEGKPGMLDLPTSIALTPTGLLVTDTWNMRLRAIGFDGTISTRAGNGQEASVNAVGTAASLYFPFALAAFADGTALVAESNDGVIRAVAPDGTTSNFAGELGRTGWTDGPIDQASVSELQGLAVRSDGAVALLDAASYRVRLLKNGVVRTLAGGSTSALVDGAGKDAGFSLPRAAVFAADGSLVVCDTGNHALRRITGSTF